MESDKPAIEEDDMMETAEALRLFTTRCGFAASAWIVNRIDRATAEKYIMDDFDALRARIENIKSKSSMNPMKYKFTVSGKRALSICMACTFVGMWLGIILIGERYDPGVFTSLHHITLGVLVVAFVVTGLLAWLTRP